MVHTRSTIILTLILTLALAPIANAVESRPRIAFLNPAAENEAFWGQLTEVMRMAADDLGVSLTVHHAGHDRFNSLKIAKRLLAQHNKPDYLIFQMQAQVGPEILAAAERANVYSLVFNTDIPAEDAGSVGKPRERFRYWLGHLFPDDEQAGFLLAKTLMDKTDQESVHPVEAIGLSGTHDNRATQDRNRGLKACLSDYENKEGRIRLNQIVYAEWERERAKRVISRLVRRYPQTSVIWAASDQMALGAIDALQLTRLKPNRDVFVGGIDWTHEGLAAVRSGELTASVGGHFMEGAWAVILLHDHFHGRDFADVVGTRIRTPMHVTTRDNVDAFLHSVQPESLEKTDFRAHSLHHNPSLHTYTFDLRSPGAADIPRPTAFIK